MLVQRGLSFALCTLACAASLLAADWRPIDPSDLALKQSPTGADAEALFREVRILNETHGASPSTNIVKEYVRLKIFTARGKEFGNVEIPSFRDQSVFDVQGRTIHPDGSIVELAKDSIFEKVIEKRGAKTRLLTFAMPAVEPGAIIEYKFAVNEGERSYRYRPLEVQSAFPVREVTFYIKPLTSPYLAIPTMRFMPFSCALERGQVTHDGYEVLKIKDVPAYHEEPHSLPHFSARQWVLLYYEDNANSGKDKYWTTLAKDRYREVAEQVKVNGEIKGIATEITSGATTDDAKLDQILKYCRTQIKDISGDAITTAELDKAKANHSSIDTIRRKQGDAGDINYAFIALAQAAGFNARRVDLSARDSFLFGPGMQAAYFLNKSDVAVEVNGGWRFFDVPDTSLAGGTLRWQDQGAYALLIDPKTPAMIQTPLIPAKDSSKTRVGVFTLSEEGHLEGDVREIIFGNDCQIWRQENLHTNDAEREESFRNTLKHRFADFELSQFKVRVSPDAGKPVGIYYHILVRNYAQRTGKRLFVQPDYFTIGLASAFPEATRHNNVYFEYPWSEIDSIDLTIPKGYSLDHGDAPGGINMPSTCSYTVKIGFDKEKNVVQYRRQLLFGDKDLLLFDAKNYPTLKKLFDAMHEGDAHMLTFKVDAPAAPAGSLQ